MKFSFIKALVSIEAKRKVSVADALEQFCVHRFSERFNGILLLFVVFTLAA